MLDAAVKDIRKQVETSALSRRHLFDEYLYLWKDAVANDAEPKAYLEERFLGEEHGLPELLRALISESLEPKGNWVERLVRVLKDSSRVQLMWVFGIADEARGHAEARLSENPDWLTADDRRLLQAFVEWHESAKSPVDDE